jgi:hypothetical protein
LPCSENKSEDNINLNIVQPAQYKPFMAMLSFGFVAFPQPFGEIQVGISHGRVEETYLSGVNLLAAESVVVGTHLEC